MKHVILLNGAPRAGKGTFSAVFGDNVEVGSIVTGTKGLAMAVFGWDGVKDAKGRKLLADLYLAAMAYNKGPLREAIALALSASNRIIIIDVRDPDVIAQLQAIFGMIGIKCTSVLIRRTVAEVAADMAGLPIDCGTGNGVYDMVLHNNGRIAEFAERVRRHFRNWVPTK